MDAGILRSRTVRESILRQLYNVFKANPDVGCLANHFFEGLSTGATQYTQSEIEAEFAELRDDDLITIENSPGVGPMPEKLIRITARGRDFVRGRFPWMKIDEFTKE
ncbi:MAG: hypothetical protein K8R91_04795 [Phycisphaerae bacterium]|nr:hypothetical protein [Phycisphaerae bacterium]